jgi:hypothetical protein
MATWKRLQRTGEGRIVDVNLDTVLYMQQSEKYTILHFAASIGADRRPYTPYVKETPDQIHEATTLAAL